MLYYNIIIVVIIRNILCEFAGGQHNIIIIILIHCKTGTKCVSVAAALRADQGLLCFKAHMIHGTGRTTGTKTLH